MTQNGGEPEEKRDGSSCETALSAAKLVQRFSGYQKEDRSGEYWLAAGVYALLMPQQDVKLYGGFAGNERQRADRDPSTNQTTILGLEFAHYDVLDEDNNVTAQKHPGSGTLVENCKIARSPGIVAVANVGHGSLKLVNCGNQVGRGWGRFRGRHKWYRGVGEL